MRLTYGLVVDGEILRLPLQVAVVVVFQFLARG